MKTQFLLVIVLFISSSVFAQSELIWSQSYDLGNGGYSGVNPKIELEDETVNIFDRINRNDHSVILNLEYNLNGNLLSETEIGAENNDTTAYGIVDFVRDENANFYIAKVINVNYNKSRLSVGRYDKDGNEMWGWQLSSQADTSYYPSSTSLLNDSLLLVSYVKSYGYPLDEDQEVFDLTSIQLLSLFDMSGNNIWNLEIEVDGENIKPSSIIPSGDSWILIESASTSRIIRLEIDGSYSVIQNYDFYISPLNSRVTEDEKLMFTNSLKYTFNLLDLESGEIESFDYPTNLPSNVYADRIESIDLDEEGSFYVTGRHAGEGYGTSSYTNCDVLTLKFNSSGDLIWQNRYQHGLNNCEIGNVIKIKGDFVYVGGQSASDGTPSPYDYFIIKIDVNTGENMGLYRYDEGDNSDDHLTDLFILDDGSILLTGITDPANWTTQYLSNIVLDILDQAVESDLQISPNPITIGTKFTVSGDDELTGYSIYSVVGSNVQNGSFLKDQERTIDASFLESGIYFVKLFSNQKYTVRKIIVE